MTAKLDIHRFDNLAAVVEYINAAPHAAGIRCAKDKLLSLNAPSAWNGDVTLERACHLALYGEPVGLADWAADYQANFPMPQTAPAWQFDVAGWRPDVTRYLAGDPACMWAPAADQGTKPIVTMLVSISYSASVSPVQVRNRGLAIVAMADQLERAGYRAEIAVTEGSETGHHTVITVKHAQEPLDLDKIAFALAHPAMLRRIAFALMERSPLCVGVVNDGGYGRPKDMPAEHIPARTVYFGALHRTSGEKTCDTPAGAMAEVQRRITEGLAVAGDSATFLNGLER